MFRQAGRIAIAVATMVLATAAPDVAASGPRKGARFVSHGRPNALSFDLGATPHAPAFDISYDRIVSEYTTAGLGFSYVIPLRGYGHLQGLEESLRVRWWPRRALDGFSAGVSITLSHQVLAFDPSVSSSLLGFGALIGYAWIFDNGLLVSMAFTLRYGVSLHEDNTICTVPRACNVAQPGVLPRLAVGVGYGF